MNFEAVEGAIGRSNDESSYLTGGFNVSLGSALNDRVPETPLDSFTAGAEF